MTGSGEFVGTTNYEDLVFKRNNAENMRITNTGISMNKEIKPNGTAGLIGQTLTSNGDGTMAWKNGAYNNNTRFQIRFSGTATSGNLNVVSIPYNLNTTNVSTGSNSFTINKTGLYHFDFALSIYVISATNPVAYPDYFMYFGTGFYDPINTGAFVPLNSNNSAWRTKGSGSFDLYVVAPMTYNINYTISNATVPSINLYLNGYLISE